jgi:hypothetical protein
MFFLALVCRLSAFPKKVPVQIAFGGGLTEGKINESKKGWLMDWPLVA